MVVADLQKELNGFAEELTSQTYLNTYRIQPKNSLLNYEGLGTRANSIWKMAQFIVATDDGSGKPLADYLKGWQILVKHYKNQYLIIAIDKNEHWEMYDSHGSLLGDNDFIKQFFANKVKHIPQDVKLQQIFYGCPGSGKSHKVSKILEERGVAEKFQIRTTFHPDTDYASFVGCYKPSMKDGNIEYNYSAQVFTEAYVKAWKNPEESVYLIIEEINRGNCAQIFGDLFQLLDRDKNTGISQYPIKADKDLADYLRSDDILGVEHEGIKDGKLRLPSNLIIYATMNTSDQSLFPMDSAFKRRWDWEYVPIDYSANKDSFHFTIKIGDAEYSWIKFLENVNDKITKVTHSEDKQMGNYFIKKSISKEEFVNKVMFYLWNEVCKEEWNTDGNFFRRKDNKEFKFTDLFTTEAEAILNEFMIETIGIQPIGKEDK